MYKLVLYMLVLVVVMQLMALQLDETGALQRVFAVKHAVNRAVHAGALQLDEYKLAQGVISIDAGRAEQAAMDYLRANLRLDAQLAPLSGSLLRSPVEVLDFAVVSEHAEFPHRYVNEAHNFEVVLRRPGTVLLVRAEYPRMFGLLAPENWVVKGAAEVYEP